MESIARACGVSKMTVSRVLNNHPRVSTATRQRVLNTAAKLNYRKSPLVSALMTQVRTSRRPVDAPVLALVHNWPATLPLTPNLRIFRSAVAEEATRLGYRLDVFHLAEGVMNSRRMFEILRARGIRGIVIEHLAKRGTRLTGDLDFFAMVAIGNSVEHPPLHRVDNDQHAEILLVWRELLQRGYQRIALVGRTASEQMNLYRRVAGFLWAQSAVSNRHRLPMLLGSGHELPSRTRLRQYLSQHRPDVVVSQSAEICDALQRLRCKVPQDIGFVHLGSHPEESRLAGIDPNWTQKGAIAVRTVLSQMSHNEFGVPTHPIVTTVKSTFRDGPSLVPSRSNSGFPQDDPVWEILRG